jgi:uncharacterized protein GlcG (DUF336 family)
MSVIPLAKASAIVDAALAAGRKAALNPLTVVVLDAGGHLVAAKREDRSGILRVEVATGKAYGALGMGVSTRLLRDRLVERPNFVSGVAAASEGRFIPVPGGVLIKDASGGIIGAVGISGDASDKDEYCAIEGVKAAGLTPDPAEPNPSWRDAAL